MQLMVELIGVGFKHSKVQSHFPDIVETLTTNVPTPHTTCTRVLSMASTVSAVCPPQRWPGGYGVGGALVQSHRCHATRGQGYALHYMHQQQTGKG